MSRISTFQSLVCLSLSLTLTKSTDYFFLTFLFTLSPLSPTTRQDAGSGKQPHSTKISLRHSITPSYTAKNNRFSARAAMHRPNSICIYSAAVLYKPSHITFDATSFTAGTLFHTLTERNRRRHKDKRTVREKLTN